jgi:hypothetical protein
LKISLKKLQNAQVTSNEIEESCKTLIQGEQELQLEQEQEEIDYEHLLHHQVNNMLKDIQSNLSTAATLGTLKKWPLSTGGRYLEVPKNCPS